MAGQGRRDTRLPPPGIKSPTISGRAAPSSPTAHSCHTSAPNPPRGPCAACQLPEQARFKGGGHADRAPGQQWGQQGAHDATCANADTHSRAPSRSQFGPCAEPGTRTSAGTSPSWGTILMLWQVALHTACPYPVAATETVAGCVAGLPRCSHRDGSWLCGRLARAGAAGMGPSHNAPSSFAGHHSRPSPPTTYQCGRAASRTAPCRGAPSHRTLRHRLRSQTASPMTQARAAHTREFGRERHRGVGDGGSISVWVMHPAAGGRVSAVCEP